jgi:hypothetical protein
MGDELARGVEDGGFGDGCAATILHRDWDGRGRLRSADCRDKKDGGQHEQAMDPFGFEMQHPFLSVLLPELSSPTSSFENTPVEFCGWNFRRLKHCRIAVEQSYAGHTGRRDTARGRFRCEMWPRPWKAGGV